MEIELKYILSQEDYRFWQEQQDKNQLGLWKIQSDSFKDIRMHSIYYDNANADLWNRKIGLRLRSENERLVFTMKQTVQRSGASSIRHEWEEELTGKINDGSALLECIERLNELSKSDKILWEAWHNIDVSSLAPVAEMRFDRRLCMLTDAGSAAEWALDLGVFMRLGNAEPFSEMEVEMKAGDHSRLKEIENELQRLRPLVPGKMSKLERCMLVGNESDE